MPTDTSISKTGPISALVIADPGIVGEQVTNALRNEKDISLDGRYTSGVEAVSAFRRRHFDIVILDIGMAREDPLITIRRMLRVDEHAKIIMVSTLSFANVRQSMTGFENGAAEFVQIPTEYAANANDLTFPSELKRYSISLGNARRQETERTLPETLKLPSPPSKEVKLRKPTSEQPKILAIGSSTGGPQALMTVFESFPEFYPLPIVITQHMPKTFTTVLASTLKKRTGKTAVEGEEGMVLKPNQIYVAPGDFHMTLSGSPANAKISINQDPPVNFCRPSVEPMVDSIVRVFGSATLLAILTGMGSDGKDGAKKVAEAGGNVIAQNFETSTVWGMPGAVAEGGYATHLLPIDQIGPAILKLTAR